jgi:hypothetical protein
VKIRRNSHCRYSRNAYRPVPQKSLGQMGDDGIYGELGTVLLAFSPIRGIFCFIRFAKTKEKRI